MKWVKGSNAKAYSKKKADIYITPTKCRKHEITLGKNLPVTVVENWCSTSTSTEPHSASQVSITWCFRTSLLIFVAVPQGVPKCVGAFLELCDDEFQVNQVDNGEILFGESTATGVLLEFLDAGHDQRCGWQEMLNEFVEVLDKLDGPKTHHWEVVTGSNDKIVRKWNR